MARSPSAIRQREITRALKAVKAAGASITRIEISPNGKIVIVTDEATVNVRGEDLDRELETWRQKNEG